MLSSVMLTYERPQVRTLIERLTEPPRTIVAVFGPRQSGKTTAVKQALRRIPWPSRYWSTDEPEIGLLPSDGASEDFLKAQTMARQETIDHGWIIRRWEMARREADREVAQGSGGFVVVFDEVQNIPQWSTVVKGLWDRDRFDDRPLHVVILGSAPMRVQSGLTESLVGRFERVQFDHWSFGEMEAAFGFELDTYLFHGGYPGAGRLVGQQGRWGQLHQAFGHPTERRAGPRRDDAHRQTSLAEAPLRHERPVLGSDRVLSETPGAPSGCRKHHNARPLPRSARHRGPRRRTPKVRERTPTAADFRPSSMC